MRQRDRSGACATFAHIFLLFLLCRPSFCSLARLYFSASVSLRATERLWFCSLERFQFDVRPTSSLANREMAGGAGPGSAAADYLLISRPEGRIRASALINFRLSLDFVIFPHHQRSKNALVARRVRGRRRRGKSEQVQWNLIWSKALRTLNLCTNSLKYLNKSQTFNGIFIPFGCGKSSYRINWSDVWFAPHTLSHARTHAHNGHNVVYEVAQCGVLLYEVIEMRAFSVRYGKRQSLLAHELFNCLMAFVMSAVCMLFFCFSFRRLLSHRPESVVSPLAGSHTRMRLWTYRFRAWVQVIRRQIHWTVFLLMMRGAR